MEKFFLWKLPVSIVFFFSPREKNILSDFFFKEEVWNQINFLLVFFSELFCSVQLLENKPMNKYSRYKSNFLLGPKISYEVSPTPNKKFS